MAKKTTNTRSGLVMALVAALLSSSAVYADEATLLSSPRAMSPVIIHVSFDVDPEMVGETGGQPLVSGVDGAFRPRCLKAGEDLSWAHGRSVDEEGYGRFNVFRKGSVRAAIDASGHGTAVFPSGFNFYRLGGGFFLFPDAGEYDLRWSVTILGETKTKRVIRKTIDVEAPVETDIEFLRRAGRHGLLQRLHTWPQEYIDGAPTEPQSIAELEKYSLPNITRLFKYAALRSDYVGRASDEERLYTEEMMRIAQKFPDSAYSPYVMYMAGSYAIRDLENLVDPRSSDPCAAVREHETYKQARKQLEFAVAHGDPYLKPRAQARLALLSMMAGRFEESKRLVEEAQGSIGGRAIANDLAKVKDEVMEAEAYVKKLEMEAKGEE